MRVKRYVADSIQEAITRVKNDLGRNAIILHTKPFKEGGFFGLFAKRRFEVIAAIDENIVDNPPRKNEEKFAVTREKNTPEVPVAPQIPVPQVAPIPAPIATPVPVPVPVPQVSTVIPAAAPEQPKPEVVPAPILSHSPSQAAEPVYPSQVSGMHETSATSEPVLRTLREEIAEVKELIRQVASKPPSPPSSAQATVQSVENNSERLNSLEWLRQYLHNKSLEGEITDYLISQIPNYLLENANYSEEDLVEYCCRILVSKLMFSEPVQSKLTGEQQVVALIGPTGVGKTTTIAKLAANFNLFEGKKVGLITIDTYRIAAVEHLKTYGDIINLPVEVVYAPSDLNQAFQNLHECDLILIDTAGRSPHNQAMMEELKRFLAHSKISLILLVISATTKYQDMVSIAENFSLMAYTHLLFTKLDETSSLGPIVSLAWKIRRPISYLTTGQNVPDDIEIAKPEKLIPQIFKSFLVEKSVL